MLELGQGNDTTPAGDLIKDSTEATFMADVVEASQEVPVIVDFWATWCGPCKQLTPALEQAVQAARGKVKLVKVDADKNQRIAQQLRIQSLPTVYAFWQGQPIDGFQGALQGSEIKQFVDRLIEQAGGGAEGGGLEEAVQAAETMLAEGAAVDAAQTFAAILSEDSTRADAYGGMVRAYLAMGEIDRAEDLVSRAPEGIAGSAEVEAARAQIELKRQADAAGPVSELKAKVEADPDDHGARLDLAKALYANGEAQAAVDELLELFRRDREWNDGAAKTQLFKIFDALKPNDPVVLNGRRKLSSMIFA